MGTQSQENRAPGSALGMLSIVLRLLEEPGCQDLEAQGRRGSQGAGV